MKRKRMFIVQPTQDFFLKKLVNKITKPKLDKVNKAIAKSGASTETVKSLTDSTTKVQKAIVEDSPKGLAKGLAIAGTIVTAGLAAPALAGGGAASAAGAGIAKGATAGTSIYQASKPLIKEATKKGLENVGTEILETIVANKNNGPKNAATVALEKNAEQILAEQQAENILQAGGLNIDPLKIGIAMVALLLVFFMFKSNA